MTPAEAKTTSALPAESVRFNGLWLLSPRADLAVVLLPLLVMVTAFIYSSATAQPVHGPANRLAIWTAQNILGNATHVILTFLVFVVRPDTLKATPGQAPRVLAGIPVMLGAGLLLFALHQYDKTAQLYVTGVVFNIFGTHHLLSQSKGWWSLHHLKGRQAGLAAPAPREFTLQRWMVPVNLSIVLVRMLFVPESAAMGDTPYVDVGQGAVLPYSFLLVLLLGWLGYWGLVFRTVLKGEAVSGPKALYLFAVASGVGLTLLAPMWGNIILPGMHGLEYYLLSSRMLEQRDGDTRAFPKMAIWPAMVLTMAPLCAIGAISALHGEVASGTLGTNVISSLADSIWWRVAVTLSLSCVLAHYWADALIYRFRIPAVRAVMLKRLGFS
ncbi:MAG: hypothetical protein QM723_14785 [Myxococcaceae bacterium]